MTTNSEFYNIDLHGFIAEEIKRAATLFPSPFVISAVGSGGKTSTLEYLYRSKFLPCHILTTTTAMLAPDLPISLTCPELSGVWYSAKMQEQPVKYKGVSQEDFDIEIQRRRLEGQSKCLFLCEADGAKMKSLKAYAEHEPVIPRTTDLVLILFGLKGLGLPLTEDNVHRSEIFSQWTGLELNETIDMDALFRTLDTGAFLKGIPPTAKVAVIFNQADSLAPETDWAHLAQRTLEQPRVDAAFFTSCNQQKVASKAIPDPLSPHTQFGLARCESAAPQFSAIVMAAGMSSRMGENKLLLPLGRQTVLEHCLHNVALSGINEVIVVTGYEREEVETVCLKAAKDFPPGINLKLVHNPDFASGQGTSVARASRQLSPASAAAFYVPGDQPFVSPILMRQMMENHADGRIVQAVHEGKSGSPVLFAARFFPELSELEGDLGGRQVIRRHPQAIEKVNFDLSHSFLDLDQPDDYNKACDIISLA